MSIVEIILIVLCTVTAAIGYFIGRRKTDIERKEENKFIEELNKEKEHQLKQYENEIKDKQDKIKIIDKQMNDSRVAQTSLNSFLENESRKKEEEIRHRLNEIKDTKFSKINQAAAKYREKLYDEVQYEIKNQEQKFQAWKNELTNDFNKIENEIDVLRSSRDALIEAARREEEMKMQENFYKITLLPNDFEDIKLLKSIEKFLNNKDPLYKLIWNTFYMTPTKEMLNRIIGKEKVSGIYKITNKTNGKVYIGQSVDLHSRLTNHIKAALGITTIAHQQVHDAMAADGLENFTFEIVEKCSKEQLNKKEKLWIETYASDKYGYNRTAGGAKEEQ